MRFIFKSATEIAGLMKSGQATSLEIVREHLAHIKQHNAKIHAVVTLREPEALAEAGRG